MIAAAGLSVPRPVSATDEDSRVAEEQWRPVVGYEDAYEVSDQLRSAASPAPCSVPTTRPDQPKYRAILNNFMRNPRSSCNTCDDKAHEPGEAMISKKSLRAVLVAFAIAFAMFAVACGSKTQPAPSQPAGTTTQPAKTSAAPGAPPGPRGTPGPTATRPPGNSPSTSGTGAPPSPSSPTSSPPVANVPGEGLPDCGQVPAGQPCYGPTPPPPVANVPGEGLPDCGQVPAGEPCYTPPRG